MAEIVVKDILDAGVHYGHRSSRWNPKMRPYIYGRRNQIHIIDIKETIRGLIRAKKYLLKVAAQGGLVLFVGTKRQASVSIEELAQECKMPLLHRAMAGWYADELPNDSYSPEAIWKNSRTCAKLARSRTTQRRCSQR